VDHFGVGESCSCCCYYSAVSLGSGDMSDLGLKNKGANAQFYHHETI